MFNMLLYLVLRFENQTTVELFDKMFSSFKFEKTRRIHLALNVH